MLFGNRFICEIRLQRYNKLLRSGILTLYFLYIICRKNKFVELANVFEGLRPCSLFGQK